MFGRAEGLKGRSAALAQRELEVEETGRRGKGGLQKRGRTSKRRRRRYV